MAPKQFSSPQYPQLVIAGVEGDKDGKGAKPGAAFVNGQLSTDDSAVAARVEEAMAYDPSLGILSGAGPATETPAGAAPLEAGENGPELVVKPSMKSMNKAELVATAEGMGIDASGTNAELVARIEAAQAGDAKPAPQGDAAAGAAQTGPASKGHDEDGGDDGDADADPVK